MENTKTREEAIEKLNGLIEDIDFARVQIPIRIVENLRVFRVEIHFR